MDTIKRIPSLKHTAPSEHNFASGKPYLDYSLENGVFLSELEIKAFSALLSNSAVIVQCPSPNDKGFIVYYDGDSVPIDGHSIVPDPNDGSFDPDVFGDVVSRVKAQLKPDRVICLVFNTNHYDVVVPGPVSERCVCCATPHYSGRLLIPFCFVCTFQC